jgi:hypothetical protein
MFHLISFMDLTIAHMVLVHERRALCLDTLVTTRILIVVIVPRVGTIFLLEGLTLTLNQDTWTIHIFPIVVHVPLDSRMSPDLPRGMGKSIGGDLDVDDKGFEQRRFEPVQSLH